MARAHVPMNITKEREGGRASGEADEDDHGPLIKYYKATEVLPDKKPRLHRLFDKQPAAWASVQITCGILSLGLGVAFAASFKINDYFLTLFRVPIMTGIMFMFVGFLSNLLYKYPGLLQMCSISNIGVLVMTLIGAVLLVVDLTKYSHSDNLQYKVEILLLSVTVLDMAISTILIVFINAEKRNQETNYTSS